MIFATTESIRGRIRAARFHLDAEVSCAVLGRGDLFVFVPLGDGWEAAETVRHTALAQGFVYCGALGVSADGSLLVLPEPRVECVTAFSLACAEFVRQHASRIVGQAHSATATNPGEQDDSVEWLTNLMSLSDTRTAGGAHA